MAGGLAAYGAVMVVVMRGKLRIHPPPPPRSAAAPVCLLARGGLHSVALGCRGTAARGGLGQPPRRARSHRLHRLHRPDGRGRVGPGAGARLGLPRQDQLQGGGGGQEGRRAVRDRPAHLPGRPGPGRGRPRSRRRPTSPTGRRHTLGRSGCVGRGAISREDFDKIGGDLAEAVGGRQGLAAAANAPGSTWITPRSSPRSAAASAGRW